MTTFVLIRHAKHDWLQRGLAGRLGGVRLSEEGRQEAQTLAENLESFPVDAIYSSPLDRTRETAICLAGKMNLKVVYDAAFLEVDFGRWTGLTFEALENDPAWKEWNENRENGRAPQGEWMRDVRSRAVDQLEQLARRHEGGRVAIISHADVIRAILTFCLGHSLDRIHELTVAPASVSIVEWQGRGGRVLGVNLSCAELKFLLSQLSIPAPSS